MRQPLNTLMPTGQLVVSLPIPFRNILRTIPFAVALAVAGCASPMEKAREEAAMAQALFDAGDLPGARAAIGRALSHRDDQLDMLLLDARIKFRMQDLVASMEAYRTVLVFDPNNQEALTVVAQNAAIMRNTELANEMIGRALANNPNDANVLLTKGVMELERKDYDAAVATANKLLESPSDTRGIVLKSRALFLKGERDASYALLRDAREKFGNDQMTSVALLENARAEGDVPVMLEQFVFLAGVGELSVDQLLDETNIRYKSGDTAGARLRGMELLNRFGADPEAVERLVDLWEEYDPEPLTGSDIQTLAGGDNLAARLAVVRHYIGRGNLDIGEPLMVNAPDPRIYGLMARLQVLKGQPAGYEAAKRILTRDTTNCEALTAQAEWEIAQGQFNAAIIPAQTLATQCRDRIDGYTLLADAYRRAGRPAGIERVYREGIAAHPADAAMTRQFTDWLLAQGRGQSAIAAVRRLAKLAPSRVSTWELYASVCQRAKDSDCRADAQAGLARAKRSYVLDPLPGVRRGDTLFGRTWR